MKTVSNIPANIDATSLQNAKRIIANTFTFSYDGEVWSAFDEDFIYSASYIASNGNMTVRSITVAVPYDGVHVDEACHLVTLTNVNRTVKYTIGAVDVPEEPEENNSGANTNTGGTESNNSSSGNTEDGSTETPSTSGGSSNGEGTTNPGEGSTTSGGNEGSTP